MIIVISGVSVVWLSLTLFKSGWVAALILFLFLWLVCFPPRRWLIKLEQQSQPYPSQVKFSFPTLRGPVSPWPDGPFKKCAILTIDDCPSPHVHLILELLKQENENRQDPRDHHFAYFGIIADHVTM